jgi:DNA-binding transcriptional LysR family regulator
MIDITKLKTFVAVADLGSFSKASEMLYITQPAVTQQIKSLERMVGAKLFQRQGGRIVLTEEGKRIYELAKALLKDYENLVEEMAKIKKDFKDSLFVGISTTLSEYKVPELLVEFHSQMPGISIRAFVENSQQIEEGLSSGVLNIGIIEREPSEKFRAIRWFYDEIIFFTHPSHPFAKEGEIEPEDLYSTELIFREVSSGTRKVVKEELERLGVIFEKLNIKIEINCGRSILSMVKCGYGCSFLSKGLLEKDLREGNIVEVKIRGFNARRWYYIVFPDDSKTTFLANSFAKFLLSKTQENIIKDEERVNL